MQIETWLNQDLLQAVKVKYLGGNVFSQDNAGNLIGVILKRGEENYSGGGTVSASVIRADGVTVAVSGALSGNLATVVLPQAAYYVPGTLSVVIKLTSNGEVTTIGAVVANVYQSSTDVVVDPGTIIPDINALIAAIEAAVASVPADYSELLAVIAPDYSTSSTYKINDYVWYSGNLFRCISAITGGESWTPAHWINTKVCTDLSDVKSKVDNDLYYTGNHVVDFVQGTIDSATGEIRSASNRISTESFYATRLIDNVSIGEGYQFLAASYSDASTEDFISVSGWGTSLQAVGDYVRFAIKKSDGTNISPTENTGFSITLKTPIKDIVTELVGDVYFTENPDTNWIQGTIDSAEGTIVSRNDRIANESYYNSSFVENVSIGSGYEFLTASYSSADTDDFIGTSAWGTRFVSVGEYVRFAIKKSDGTNISPTENTGFVLTLKTPVKSVVSENTKEIKYDNERTNVNFCIGSKNQIARLGWDVYSLNTPPEQSVASYKLAFKNGCRVMLGDVRKTSDGYFVLWHDATLKNSVKHSDGTSLTPAELETRIESSTLSELNEYDYGIYKGSQYAGMKIPMLADLLEWCGLTNCVPMLEIKTSSLSQSDCNKIASMCKMYGLHDRVIIDEYLSNIVNRYNYWISALPTATYCIISGTDIEDSLAVAAYFKQHNIQTLLTLSTADQLVVIQDNYGNLDLTKVQAITDTGTYLTYTEIQNESDLESFSNEGYLSIFKYISSSYVNINKWIMDNFV